MGDEKMYKNKNDEKKEGANSSTEVWNRFKKNKNIRTML